MKRYYLTAFLIGLLMIAIPTGAREIRDGVVVTSSGDVTSVGDCTSGACLDGSSDGGETISLYDGDSNKLTLGVANLSSDLTLDIPATWTTAILGYVDPTSSIQGQFDARCLKSVLGTAIGTGLTLDSTTLKVSTGLQSLSGLSVTNGDIIYATGANAYAKLDNGAQGTLLMGNGAGAPSWLGAGTAGYFLIGAGAADPVWTTQPTLTSLETLALTNGDLIYATGADALAVLDAGTSGYILKANGAAAPSWSDTLTADITLAQYSILRGDGTSDAEAVAISTNRLVGRLAADIVGIEIVTASEDSDSKIPTAGALFDGLAAKVDKDSDNNIWQAVYVAAAAFECDGTNCTDPAAAQINSGPNQYYATCSDAAGTIEFSIGMPENWDGGSIIIEPIMFSAEGTPAGTIEWELSIQKCANDEAIDNTWVTTNGNIYFEDAETATTTVDTQYDLFKCKNKTAMAAGGAGGDQLFVKLTRDNDDATHDTSTQDINVLGVKVYYQIDDMDEKD